MNYLHDQKRDSRPRSLPSSVVGSPESRYGNAGGAPGKRVRSVGKTLSERKAQIAAVRSALGVMFGQP